MAGSLIMAFIYWILTMTDTVPKAFYTIHHVICTAALQDLCCYSNSVDKETEAKRSQVTNFMIYN